MPPRSASVCPREAVPFCRFQFDKEPSGKSRRGWQAHRGPSPWSSECRERAVPKKSLEIPSPLRFVERGSVHKRPNQTGNVRSYVVVHPISKKRVAVIQKFTKPSFHRQVGITRNPRCHSLATILIPSRKLYFYVDRYISIAITIQRMNFTRQSGFRGFITARKAASLPR